MFTLPWSSSQDPRATRMASSLSTTTFMRRKRCVCSCVCFPNHSFSLFLPSTVASLSFFSFQYLHAFINEVTVLVPVLSTDSKHTFAIYTPERTKQRWPIRLTAATELEMHDWVCKEGLNLSLQEKKLLHFIIFHFSSSRSQAGVVKCVLLRLQRNPGSSLQTGYLVHHM